MHRLLRTHATCALLAAASTARAQVAYDNFGPDPGFWPNSERVIGGGSGLAYQFVSQASGDVTSIRVALMAQEGPSIGRLEIYSSDPLLGGPLDRLDSWTMPLPPAESNEVTQLMIDDGPTLTAGRVYWMAALAEPGTTLIWRQTNGFDEIAGVATWDGSGWSLLGAADVPGAYSITVPAPHAGLLIVLAGSLVSRRSRRAHGLSTTPSRACRTS